MSFRDWNKEKLKIFTYLAWFRSRELISSPEILKHHSKVGKIVLVHSFFIKTSKFCLRLAVLNFFHFWGWNVLNLFLFPHWTLQYHKDECQTEYNKNILYFISFILFLSSSAHIQPLGVALQKSGSATVLEPIKKYLKRSPIFH